MIFKLSLVVILSFSVIIDCKTFEHSPNKYNRLNILEQNPPNTQKKIPFLKSRLGCAEDTNEDLVYSITTDQSGNIFVTGSVYQEATGSDVYLSMFSSNGNWLWSEYLSGNQKDYGTDIILDNQANIIVAGQTTSNDFNTTEGAIKESPRLWNDYDAFITKFSPTRSILWSTYLGGDNDEIGICSLDVDSQDNIIIAGRTESTDFPTLNAFNSSYNGGQSDLFVAKINSTGSLVWSTYLGGSSYEYGIYKLIYDDYLSPNEIDIIVDNEDNVIVTSTTRSEDFPVTYNAYQSQHAGPSGTGTTEIGGDLFVSKISSNGSKLLWSTFLGGDGDELGHSLFVDTDDNVIVTGKTSSTNFPVFNAYQPNSGGAGDLFLTKFSSSGILLWSTYFGGNRDDRGYSTAIDSMDNIIVTGRTVSENFPVNDAYMMSGSGGVWGDAFLSKFTPTGNLVWSTYFGGTGEDDGVEISIDNQDNIIMSGNTDSTDFPIKNAYQYSFGGLKDAYLSKFNSSGGLCWSTRALIATEPNSDPDNDELMNIKEFQYLLDPFNPDTDNDNMNDGGEVILGLDPLVDDAYDDNDDDGLPNIIEFWSGGELDVNNNDTDGDGMSDGWEVNMLLDPTTDDADADQDNDSIPNLWEFQYNLSAINPLDAMDDLDNDDLINLYEFQNNTNPHNSDTDADGIPDGWEVKYKFDPLNPDDATEDFDKDGLTNRVEYQLGFNPRSPHELYAGAIIIFIIVCLIAGIFLRIRKLNQEAVMLGFKSNTDKKAAFKAGFKSAQERNEAKTGGFMSAEIYNIVKAAGWFNIEEMVSNWQDEISTIENEITDEVFQDSIHLILSSFSPIQLSEIESSLTPLFDKIKRVRRRITQISSLQQSLITHFKSSKTPPIIGLTLDELTSFDKQSASLLKYVTENNDRVNSNIIKQRTFFAPWPQLLSLIQITKDRAPIDLSKIAKIVNCTNEQAEKLIQLLLKEDETIGSYDLQEKVFTKGFAVEALIESYITRVKKIIKDFKQ
jgi:hypothetical protein